MRDLRLIVQEAPNKYGQQEQPHRGDPDVSVMSPHQIGDLVLILRINVWSKYE